MEIDTWSIHFYLIEPPFSCSDSSSFSYTPHLSSLVFYKLSSLYMLFLFYINWAFFDPLAHLFINLAHRKCLKKGIFLILLYS